jgi:cytochrome P450
MQTHVIGDVGVGGGRGGVFFLLNNALPPPTQHSYDANPAGYTIGFALTELAKHKDVQAQLRDDLRRASKDPTGKKRLVDSPLLKRVVKETMRLWPVAGAGGARILPEDMVVTGKDSEGREQPMTLPKGSIATINSYAIMRDEDTFVRPDEWLPNRWENPSEDMKSAFIPFMVGRRSCPGQLLAMSESELFLARLLIDYEWSLVKETPPEYSITLKIKGTILQAKKIA